MSTGSENEQLTPQTTTATPITSSNPPTTPTTTTSPTTLPTPTTTASTTSSSSSSSSSITAQQVLSLLSDADSKTLREVICQCQNLLKTRDTSHNDNILAKQFYVTPNILTACSEAVQTSSTNEAGTLRLSPARPIQPVAPDFRDQLALELESLGLREKSGSPGRRKVASQWVVVNPSQTNLPSEDMDKFPQISRLMERISHQTGGCVFNSCIVNFYADGAARTRPHADDESYIDQSSPIACFSVGQTREIGIFDKKNGQLVGKHALQDGSLLVMNPGAQENTLHQVLPMKSGHCGERFSISFRKIEYTEVKNEWPFTQKAHISSSKQSHSPSCKSTLVLGTSIPYYLDYEKLSGSSGRVKVVNLCQRGAKISHLHDVLDEHYKNESSDTVVDKVIVSVGTNDLRNNKKDTVGHLYTPMENLVRKIRTYYPGAIIYIQSLLPQRVQNAFTVSNVLGFNKLLIKLAALNKCFYLDIFADFLGENNHPNPSLYRWDGVHLSNKGLSTLARAFIAKIRGRFNPITRV